MTAKIINAYKTFPADLKDDLVAILKDTAAAAATLAFIGGSPFIFAAIATVMH